MNKDQKLLEEAYCKIYESTSAFETLTDKEKAYVNKIVDVMVDKYPQSLNDIYRTFTSIVEEFFDNEDLHYLYDRSAYDVLGSFDSLLSKMHRKNEVLNNTEQLKDDFKQQIANKINKQVSISLAGAAPSASILKRQEELRNAKLDKELSPDFDVKALEDF